MFRLPLVAWTGIRLEESSALPASTRTSTTTDSPTRTTSRTSTRRETRRPLTSECEATTIGPTSYLLRWAQGPMPLDIRLTSVAHKYSEEVRRFWAEARRFLGEVHRSLEEALKSSLAAHKYSEEVHRFWAEARRFLEAVPSSITTGQTARLILP